MFLTKEINEIVISEQFFLLIDASGLIKYWHISTGESLHTHREKCQLLTGALDPTCSYLAAGGTSNENYVYELATGKKLNTYGAR